MSSFIPSILSIACTASTMAGCATHPQSSSSDNGPLTEIATDTAPERGPAMVFALYRPIFNHLLFDRNSADLKPESMQTLDQLIVELKRQADATVVLHGHTCDLGATAYNFTLSERRAEAARQYLINNGIDAGRLSVVAHGESDPAVPNENESNRKLNRRVGFDTTFLGECKAMPVGQ